MSPSVSLPRRLLDLAPALLLGLLAALAPARAAELPWERPWNPDTAAIARAAAAFPAAPGEPVVVLKFEASYRYDEAGRETKTEHLVYRIVAPGAHDSWSVVQEQFSPWHQARPEIQARVITPDGKAHLLDPAVIAESGAGSNQDDLFDDQRALRAPLPATGPGAVVEEVVTVRETAPFFDRGVVRYVDLAQSVACRRARLVLDVPAASPISWVARLLPAIAPRDEQSGGRRRLSFEWSDLPGYQDPEPGLPPDEPRIAHVAFSTGASWGDIARRYSAIVDQAIRGSDISPLLEAAKGAGSQDQAIARILARLADIRYTGVELGDGGIMPRPPAETWRRRFGDCKDKAVLLVAALRALDIPAYVALLAAGEGEVDVEPSLPGLGAFDHAIVAVPGSPPMWIDPTDPFARVDELPVPDQGRLALIASPTATGLTRTPEATSADNREVETREFFLADLGPARAAEVTEYHGATERDLRAYYAAIDRDQLRQELADYAGETYLAKELSGFDFSAPSRLAEPFRLKLDLRQSRRGMTDTAEAAVALLPAAILARLPDEITGDGDQAGARDEAAARTHDYYFTRPFTVELRYRIVPPAGFVPRPLPPSQSRALGTATLTEQYAAAPDGTVTANWRLDTGKRRLKPAELAAMQQAVAELKESKPTLLVFEQVGEAHLTAGRVRPALEEFRKEAAGSPKKALPHTRIARALLAGGLGEAARDEALAAVALEPGSAVAQSTLGWVLQHDALGRRFGRGYERDRALAAYRKARALAPDNGAVRADLAILLEHDATGRRYTSPADLAAAIAEYQSLRADLKEEGMDDNLLIALMYAGRFEEMKQLAGELEATDEHRALHLVATAATAGSEAALREAERAFADADHRLTALASAAQNLIAVRRYPEAAALLARAGQLSPRAAALLTTAEVLRRSKRYEELTFDPASPATPLRKLLLLPAGGPTSPSIRTLFVKRVADTLDDGADDKLREAMESVRSRVSGDLPVAAAVDLGLAALHETISGNDATGFRVELQAAMGEVEQRTTAFVVREGRELRLAGLANSLDTLGEEALARLARGDLAGARQWLDWARGELGESVPDDPFLGTPFASLWRKGRDAGLEETRCAAAALAAEGEDDIALPVLVACRDATSPAGGEAARVAFDTALARHYQARGRYAEMLEAAERLAAARPDADTPFSLLSDALARLGRWSELGQVADQRLGTKPDDALAFRARSEVAFAAGDLGRAESLLARIVSSGKVEADILNRLAWGALLQGHADDRALEWSQRSATLSGFHSAAALHTLAALYAEQGKTAEAYQVILQAIESRHKAAPTPDDWYVFGRLAEQYGLPDVAERLYRRALPKATGAEERFSSRALAEARLAAIAPAAPLKSGHGGARTARPSAP